MILIKYKKLPWLSGKFIAFHLGGARLKPCLHPFQCTKNYQALVLYLQMVNYILHLQSTSDEPMKPIDNFVRFTPKIFKTLCIAINLSDRPDRSDPVMSGLVRLPSLNKRPHPFVQEFLSHPFIQVIQPNLFVLITHKHNIKGHGSTQMLLNPDVVLSTWDISNFYFPLLLFKLHTHIT